MIKYLLSILFLMLLSSSNSLCKSVHFDASSIGSSAKSIALANIKGFSQSSSSIFDNMAGLNRIDSLSVSLFQSRLMDEALYVNLSLGIRMHKSVLGIGYASQGVSEIPHTTKITFSDDDHEFDILNYFNQKREVFKVGYSYSQTRYLHFGLGLNLYKTTIQQYSGSGFNFDLGVLYERNKFAFSVLFKNFINAYDVKWRGPDSYPGGSEDMRFSSTYGVKYSLPIKGLDMLGEISLSNSQHILRNVAFSYSSDFSFLKFFDFSVGRHERLTAIDEVASLNSFGFGFSLYGFRIDYAITQVISDGSADYQPFGTNSYASISMNF